MSDRLKRITEFPDARIVASVIDRETKKMAREIAYRVAARLAGKLRSTILNQTMNWTPLSEDWLRRKEALGWDTRILRATGAYVNSIVARRISDSRYEVAPGNTITESGVSLKQIGAWLEYGTIYPNGHVRMPARPHWRPIWRQFMVKDQEEIIKDIQSKLTPMLRNAYKPRRSGRTVKDVRK